MKLCLIRTVYPDTESLIIPPHYYFGADSADEVIDNLSKMLNKWGVTSPRLADENNHWEVWGNYRGKRYRLGILEEVRKPVFKDEVKG